MAPSLPATSGKGAVRAPLRQPGGFTLVELVFVVAIAAILVSLSVAGFSSLTQSQQAKNASFELHSSLILARSEAIKRNGNVTLTPTGGDWAAGWSMAAADGTSLKRQSALSGAVVTGGPTSVVYTRSGRLPTTVATMPAFQIDVSATTTSNVRCVKIELTGMPRTALGACS